MFPLYCLLVTAAVAGGPDSYFKIKVVDDETGRGVPLVELRTVHNVHYYTDSAGVVAFREVGLMDEDVFFHVSSHGYEFPKDHFGFRGVRLRTTPGGRATLRIKRFNIAERLYRVTGAGIYRDSLLAGDKPSIPHSSLNGQVLGSDSVVNAVYRGRIYWFWGDTNRPAYPLGNFHVTGASSELPSQGGLDPSHGVKLDYFTDADGFAKEMAKMPGNGPTWIDGLVSLQDDRNRERLFAKYVKVKPPLSVYERGLVEFDDDSQRFVKRLQLDLDAALYPRGHSFIHQEQGVVYVYFAAPYPLIRVPADPDALLDPSQYETYTYLEPGSRDGSLKLDRNSAGELLLAWKKDVVPLTPRLEERLIDRGDLRTDEAYFRMRDATSGKRVRAHGGSVCWNDFRKKWIMIFVESGGRSNLGEIWFAEAATPVGPWLDATRIVTHDRYSFYNPKQHPMFDQQQGRIVYFEGTYTAAFSGNKNPTPRYNYNQIMYRLDLADPRLAP